MTRDPIVVATGTTVLACAKLMRSEDIGSVGVESNGVLFGVLTDRDIVLRAVAGQLDPAETPVEAVCSRDPVTVDPERPLERACPLMAERGVRRLFVVRDGRPVGILTARTRGARVVAVGWRGDSSPLAPSRANGRTRRDSGCRRPCTGPERIRARSASSGR